MFGYIRADKAELKMREYEVYRGVYCSLCRRLGKSYGLLSRLTLSYDFTFLALLDISLREGCTAFKSGRCVFNPAKKCNYLKNTEQLDFSAAAATVMLYYKILDDIKDEKGFKKLFAILVKPIFSRAHKKAALRFAEIEKYVSGYIESQNAVEDENCKSVDGAAEPTAAVMANTFSLLTDNEGQKRALYRLGYCLGRYIYLLDAACDYQKDLKSGSYNVLRNIDGDIKDYVSKQLYLCINEAAKAFELLDIKKHKSVLGNVIYQGLEQTFKKELDK
ncbi:MAG: hypothetical protein J5659_06815 [Clostridia bacterium]|nr:hypothetical protein [Clostridia bacterium]